MDAAQLLKELQGDEPVKALVSFLEEIESSNNPLNLILEFQALSPKCDDIIQLLNQHKLRKVELSTIFNVLGYILMSFAEDETKNGISLHITRWVLQNHSGRLRSLLLPLNTSRCTIAALHCVTGMVMSGSEAANEVLTHLQLENIHFKVLAERRDASMNKDLRTAVFYLVLAFLNLEDSACLKEFLLKEELSTCVFQGLASDPPEIVIRLLTLIHESIVLNMSISKTTKIRLFNADRCSLLMKLYFHSPKDKDRIQYSDEEKNEIKKSLHSLMITLCSEPKYGIVFKSKQHAQPRGLSFTNNKPVYAILKSIQSPWEFKEGRDLVCKTLLASPDLIKHFMKDIEPFLEINPTSGFFTLIKLLVDLIENLDILKDIEIQLAKSGVRDVEVNIKIISNELITSLIENPSNMLRHAGIMLLLAIYKKSNETIEKVNGVSGFSHFVKVELKKIIMKGLFFLGGGVSKFVDRWTLIFGSKHDESTLPKWYINEYPSKFTALADITELFTLHSELYGFHIIREKINPLHMLQKVQSTPQQDTEVDIESYENALTGILKLLSIAQRTGSLDSFNLSRKDSGKEEDLKVNESLFHLLMNVYFDSKFGHKFRGSNSKKELEDLSLSLLNYSLDAIGLSSNCKNDIKIWLDKVNQKQQKDCSEFLAKVISMSVTNLLFHLDVLINLESESRGADFRNIDLMEEVNEITTQLQDNETIVETHRIIPFSSLILGAIDVLNDDSKPSLIQYFSLVVDDYIHHVASPEILVKHLLENESILANETKQYLKSWLGEVATDPLISGDDLSSKLKVVFVTKNVPSDDDTFSEQVKDIVDSDQMIAVCRQVLLYLKFEFESSKKLKRRKKSKAYWIKVFRNIIEILSDSHPEKLKKVFEYLMQHHSILESYSPLVPADALHIEIENMADIVFTKLPNHHCVLKPLFEKLTSQVKALSPKDEFNSENSLSKYLNNYSLLTYDCIEKMLKTVLTSLSLPYTDPYLQLIIDLSESLLKHSSTFHQPSKEISALLLSKLIWMAQNDFTGKQEQNVVVALSNIFTIVQSKDCLSTLKADELETLFNLKPFNSILFSYLVLHMKPSLITLVAKKLNKCKINLQRHSAFILALLKKENDTLFQPYFIKVKEKICDWAVNVDEDADEIGEIYTEIIQLMLEKDMFEFLEVKNMCDTTLELTLISKTKPAHHFLSLVPFFEYLSRNLVDEDVDDSTSPNLQLLSLCLHGVTKMYKEGKPEIIERLGAGIMSLVSSFETFTIRNAFCTNKMWLSFVKQVLKVGLSDEKNGPLLLECVTELSRMVYSKKKKEGVLPPATLYQMLRSHSQYIHIMLSHEKESCAIKEKIAFLQLALVECVPKVCEERHVPLLLGTYGATRSLCDQAIFKTLYLYEVHGHMPTFNPSLWGRAAVTHFAVEEGPGVVDVKYREPKHHQVLALLQVDRVVKTALHFDMHATMEPSSLLPSDPTLYDQRFLLTVFMHIARDQQQLSVMALVEKGIVAIAVAALSSHCEQVWSIGALLLKNLVSLFETSRYQNLKLHWLGLVYVLVHGMNGQRIKVPSILVHFMVQASQLMLNPQDNMFKPVMNYLYLRQYLNLKKVPELYVLFFSDNLELNKEHRAFFLRLLASGIKEDLDFNVCLSSFVPKLIIGLITSPTANSHLRVLALNVIKSMVSVWEGAKSLMLDQGLLVELPLALEPNWCCPKANVGLWIEAVVDILTTLWGTWKSMLLKLANPDFESGGKRKMEDSTAWERPNKKRKLAQKSEEEPSVGNGFSLTKTKEEVGFAEIFACLGKILPKIIVEGSSDSLAKSFDLLHEMLQFKEAAGESTSPKMTIVTFDFLRLQANSWIDESSVRKKLGTHSLDDESEVFPLDDSWRWKPLKQKLIQRGENEMEAEEQVSDIYRLFQSTRRLFGILNTANVH